MALDMRSEEGLEHVVRSAKSHIERVWRKHKTVVPGLVLYHFRDRVTGEELSMLQLTIVPYQATGPDEKTKWAEMARRKARDVDAFATVFFNEAWAASLEGYLAHGGAEGAPDREEIVVLVIEHCAIRGEVMTLHAQIDRSDDSLGPWKGGQGKITPGVRMNGFLPGALGS